MPPATALGESLRMLYVTKLRAHASVYGKHETLCFSLVELKILVAGVCSPLGSPASTRASCSGPLMQVTLCTHGFG